MTEYSTTVSIIYFLINTVFLTILAAVVYRQGAYLTVKSKSYLKDVWNQRKIYAPLIIHFYVCFVCGYNVCKDN